MPTQLNSLRYRNLNWVFVSKDFAILKDNRFKKYFETVSFLSLRRDTKHDSR
jgi:hypothetical protein